MEAKNYMEHDIDQIKHDIERKGYSELDTFYIINMYRDMNLREYFLEYNLKFKVEYDKYIFTKI